MAPCLKRGYLRKFESLKELADAYEVPAQPLLATVERFNRAFGGKTADEMGKPIQPGAAPLVAAPFYGIRIWPKVHYTMGGVRISPGTEVLDLGGSPIHKTAFRRPRFAGRSTTGANKDGG